MCYKELSTAPPPPQSGKNPKMASPVGNSSFRLALRFPLTVAHLPPASCLLLTPTPGQEESLSGGLTGGQGRVLSVLHFSFF